MASKNLTPGKALLVSPVVFRFTTVVVVLRLPPSCFRGAMEVEEGGWSMLLMNRTELLFHHKQ